MRTTVGTLSAEERQELAEQWGYTSVGEPLPEGVSLNILTQALPDRYTEIDVSRLALGAAAPLALMAAGYLWMWFMHTIIPGWQMAICWVLVGTGYAGLFTIAHDAARRAMLPQSPLLNDLIGSIIMAPALYSLEAWRIKLLTHFIYPNVLGEDDASWQPLTKERLQSLSGWALTATQAWATTPFKLLGSIGHWLSSFSYFDLKRYYQPLRVTMLASWSVPFWFMALGWSTLIAVAGPAGWFNCWFMPWLVFHTWLSLLTLLQHTAPHVPFARGDGDYDVAQATLNGTITVSFPRWLEWVLNDANYHLPQHLRPDVPFYHAREATQALRQRLGPYMSEGVMSGRLLRNVVERWQVFDEGRATYITLERALQELEGTRQEAAGAGGPEGGPALAAA